MRVFMLGWEFPPYISGGLGTACYGMTKALDELGVEVCFVLPMPVPVGASGHVDFRTPADLTGLTGSAPTPPAPPADPASRPAGSAPADTTQLFEHVEIHRLHAFLQAYGAPTSQEEILRELRRLQAEGELPDDLNETDLTTLTEQVVTEGAPPAEKNESADFDGKPMYGGDLMTQIRRYERLAVALAKGEQFDVIHAHDWMTYPAGLAVSAATGKPLVVHVHSTEFDRAGENVNQMVYEIERAGMHGADRVICVSHLTATICRSRYDVAADRISVVYNAVELPAANELQMHPITQTEKIVLFLGRITMQKGPEYFLRAAKKVVEKFQNVRFVIAGSGDMITQCIKEVADLRLGRYVTFTGFLRGGDVSRIFSLADLYVMPSVSEPFGIAPLEALSHNVPAIISKQSGVSEVLQNVLKVDFWDIDEMADKILAVLRHPPLQRALRESGQIEVQQMSWRDSAEDLQDIYAQIVRGNGAPPA